MDSTLQVIVNIGAAATALVAIIGFPVAAVKLWPLIKRAVTIGASLEKLPEMAVEIAKQSATLAEHSGVLETIRHEVEFNNGSSVKDAIRRIEQHWEDSIAKPEAPTTTINANGGMA